FRAWLNEQVGSESLRERLDHLITKDTFLTSLQTQFDTVPPSLVHPDLFCGNWAMDGERIRIFDWGDAMWTTGGYIVVAQCQTVSEAMSERCPL
ncbi:MAG: phosphotransferase, partial [Pseudomonadota bacterium]